MKKSVFIISKIRFFSVVIIFFSIIFSISCKQSNTKLSNTVSITGSTMGTTFSVKIVRNNFLLLGNVKKKLNELEQGINSILEDVNNKMSTYRKDSEISRFNSYGKNDWFTISNDTVFVISASLDVSRKTMGKFDITVGPLVNIWGFGKDFSKREIPEKTVIEKLKKKIGYKFLDVRYNPPALKKKLKGLYCDLSAIAKGFGVDRVAEFLDSKGFLNYLVEIGGEIRVRGVNGAGATWSVGIKSPKVRPGLSRVIHISDCSMATSGDYMNYFEKNGKRYSHTIDPDTGYPVIHDLVSVTVIHRSCMMADAYATAIDVLGPKKGLKFALKEKIPVFMIRHSGNKFIEQTTPLFEKLLKK